MPKQHPELGGGDRCGWLTFLVVPLTENHSWMHWEWSGQEQQNKEKLCHQGRAKMVGNILLMKTTIHLQRLLNLCNQADEDSADLRSVWNLQTARPSINHPVMSAPRHDRSFYYYDDRWMRRENSRHPGFSFGLFVSKDFSWSFLTKRLWFVNQPKMNYSLKTDFSEVRIEGVTCRGETRDKFVESWVSEFEWLLIARVYLSRSRMSICFSCPFQWWIWTFYWHERLCQTFCPLKK